jgi:hypothetical protein
MTKIAKDLGAGLGSTLHPRENTFITGGLAAANAELDLGADGAAAVGLVVTGTYVGTMTVEGSIDGTNWDSIPMRPVNAGGIYVLTLASAAVGRWIGPCAGFKQVRVRTSAYTSGTATCYLVADISPLEMLVLPKSLDQSVTNTAAAAVGVTLTLPAPGAGMFHYIGRIIVQRHATAALTANTAPILVTTTNLPGSRVLSFAADAAAQGVVATEIIEPATPIRSSAANTATTLVCPGTVGVIWRATADYFVAPYS